MGTYVYIPRIMKNQNNIVSWICFRGSIGNAGYNFSISPTLSQCKRWQRLGKATRQLMGALLMLATATSFVSVDGWMGGLTNSFDGSSSGGSIVDNSNNGWSSSMDYIEDCTGKIRLRTRWEKSIVFISVSVSQQRSLKWWCFVFSVAWSLWQ